MQRQKYFTDLLGNYDFFFFVFSEEAPWNNKGKHYLTHMNISHIFTYHGLKNMHI